MLTNLRLFLEKNNSMKNILISALLLVAIGCSSSKDLTKEQEQSAKELLSSKKPNLENFSYSQEVEFGTVATAQWWFSNAISVYFPHTRVFYKASDKISFTINESKELKLIATNASGDTAIHTFFITVVPPKKPSNSYTIKGPIQPKNVQFPIGKSTKETNYIAGMLDFTEGVIEQLSIRNIISDDTTLSVTVLPLDTKGNFIANLDAQEAFTSWTIHVKNGTQTMVVPVSNIQEQVWTKESPKPLDISFVIDKSSEANLQGLFRQMLPFLAITTDEDKYSLFTYNQDVQTIALGQNKKEMVATIQNSMSMSSWGMSAPYTALQTALDEASARTNEFVNPMIVLIAHSNDNASINTNVTDVIKKARKLGIPISIVAYGNSLDSYYYKLITSATGGAYYSMDNSNNVMEFVHIIQEMYYAQKIGYTLSIPFPKMDNATDNLTLQVSAKQVPRFPSFEDNSAIRPKVAVSSEMDCIYQYDSLQVLESASLHFGFQQSIINPNYKSILKKIASILVKDPTKQILITGNTSPKEFSSSKEHSILALNRAKSISSELQNEGVMSSQIQLKELGASKPLYSIEKSQWEEESNRRVEIVWLDAVRKPFEISAGSVASEFEAQTKVQEWNERGIKSYYDAYLVDKMPMYKIILWGYTSKNEAEMSAKNLSKKYNVTLSVD